VEPGGGLSGHEKVYAGKGEVHIRMDEWGGKRKEESSTLVQKKKKRILGRQVELIKSFTYRKKEGS